MTIFNLNMKYQNNATLIRKNLLIKVAQAFFAGKLPETVDSIATEMFPKTNRELLRCCVYKERAIIRHRIMCILGFSVEEDYNEAVPLREYAEKALHREIDKSGEILSVLDIACSGCVQSQYLITNACRGCMARPCKLNCPKKAIKVTAGQAAIDYDLCVDCGRCMQVCPYHAIIRVPIPCAEACPVNAIGKNEFGKAVIDFAKCISCGQCMMACPFGSVMERSQFVDVLKILGGKKTTVAMLAPAIAGNQFKGNIKQIAAACKQLGFSRVFEVAGGADITSKHETAEFAERMHNKEKMMTSSCCPAYTEAVKKHLPELQPFVSRAATPMHYSAELVKKSIPDAITVFVGPCIAKRKEAQFDSNVDLVLTFEEIEALFAAKEIDVAKCAEIPLENEPSDKARGFATTCGVTEALLEHANQDVPIKTEFVDGLSKTTIKQLKSYATQPVDFNFLEVMGCEGGCVGGPCAIGKMQQAQQTIREIAKNKGS